MNSEKTVKTIHEITLSNTNDSYFESLRVISWIAFRLIRVRRMIQIEG